MTGEKEGRYIEWFDKEVGRFTVYTEKGGKQVFTFEWDLRHLDLDDMELLDLVSSTLLEFLQKKIVKKFWW